RLEIACPGKRFVFPSNAVCPTMKMIDLNSLLRCMQNMSGEVSLSKEIIDKAHTPVKRMIEIK
ncbi:MAG: quinolinate synthase NadA, partial [Candidatus Methanomethylophilaceae archaeon]